MPSTTGVELTAYQAFSMSFFDISALVGGTVQSPNPETLVATSLDGTKVITFTGADLVYDPVGGLTDGTVTDIAVTIGGSLAVEATGLDALLVDLVALAEPGGGEAVYQSLLSGGDTIAGSDQADYLVGSAGRDKLTGDAGDDTIYGGADRDRLTGGAGADTFFFGDMFESTQSRRGRDTITDFNRAEGDLIDITGLGVLTFNETGAFDGTPGTIIATERRTGMLIEIDLDGDFDADFSVMINGATSVRSTDFVVLVLE